MMIDAPTGSMPAAMKAVARERIAIVHNPVAGGRSGKRLRAVVDRLADLGVRPTLLPTAWRGDAMAIASRLRRGAWDAVVVAGGDGTINEAINGLVCGVGAGPVPPLGVIPLGTANVLACELELPTAPEDLANLLVHGEVLPVHLARANDRLLVMMAGVGFDAYVCGRVDPRLKRQIGRGAYWLTSVPAFIGFGRRCYRVEIDGVTYSAASMVIANGHGYGGRYTCAPMARLTDAVVHVCLFQRDDPVGRARYGLALVDGSLADRADVQIVSGRRVVVSGHAGEPVQCDGDLVTRLPLHLEADAARLPVIAPAAGVQRPAMVIPSMRTVGASRP